MTDEQGAIESALPGGVLDILGYTFDRKQRGRLQVTARAGDSAVVVLRQAR